MIRDGDKVLIKPTGETGKVTVVSQLGVCYVKVFETGEIKAVNQSDVEKI